MQLSTKYHQLIELRRSREVLEAQGIFRLEGEAARVRQSAARALARAFPGALRELEELSVTLLLERLQVARAVEQGELAAPLWLCVVRDFHVEMREALAIKGYLATQSSGRAAEEILSEVAQWLASHPARCTSTKHVTPAFIAEHVRPPEGRLTVLVLRRLETRYELSREQLVRALYQAS